MTPPEKALSSLVSRAVQEYSMIEKGDRILLAASGGKDSTSLLFDLAAKRRYRYFEFELEAVHIASKRKDVRKRIDALTGGKGDQKRNLFYSLRNIRESYLT